MNLPSFRGVARSFKAVFLDSYGVLKNHDGPIPGAQQTLQFIRDEGITLRILTNAASRTQAQQLQAFEDVGLHGLKEHEIITSGMLARQFLSLKIKEGTIGYLGTPDSARYISDSGLNFCSVANIDLNNTDEISAFVFLDDEGFDWNSDINKTVNLLRRKSIPVLVANSDKYYPTSGGDVAIAIGGLSRLVEYVVGQKFMRFGKPDSQMFIYAFDDINAHGSFKKHDILMVGDTLDTDILGGNKFGVQTMLVLSGNTRAQNVHQKIKASSIIPDFMADSIAG